MIFSLGGAWGVWGLENVRRQRATLFLRSFTDSGQWKSLEIRVSSLIEGNCITAHGPRASEFALQLSLKVRVLCPYPSQKNPEMIPRRQLCAEC